MAQIQGPEEPLLWKLSQQKKYIVDQRSKQKIAKVASGKRNIIEKTKLKMERSGYHPRINELSKTQAMAEHLLFSMGISAEVGGAAKNFTTLGSQTAEIDLQNSTIIDNKTNRTKPTPSSHMRDKFGNPIDPFYELDEDKAMYEKNAKRGARYYAGPDLTALASSVCLVNTKFTMSPKGLYLGHKLIEMD